MPVVWWFTRLPVLLWDGLTPLSFGRLAALLLAFTAYGAVNLAAVLFSLAFLRGVARGLRRSFRKETQ